MNAPPGGRAGLKPREDEAAEAVAEPVRRAPAPSARPVPGDSIALADACPQAVRACAARVEHIRVRPGCREQRDAINAALGRLGRALDTEP
jgi:hypothetical protein